MNRISTRAAPAVFILLAMAVTGAQKPVRWTDVLEQPEAWYTTAEAQRIADNVMKFQRRTGGWPKDIDMTLPWEPRHGSDTASDSTIDNAATVTQIRLLARVGGAATERYRQGARRGIAYLLSAQYPNGGWPQFYPVRKDYSRHITFNDNAMVNVMTLLDEVAAGRHPYVDEESRGRARAAVARGVEIMLRTQVTVAGTLTAWCAQHDEVTLEPRGARTYEHPSLSGMETAGIVRFLMTRAPATPAVATAIEAAVRWLDKVKLTGWRLEQRPEPSTPLGYDRVLIRDPAAPPLWARFYEIGTDRPIFSSRDGVIRYSLDEISYERRNGYAWVGDWPRRLLSTDLPDWRAKVHEVRR